MSDMVSYGPIWTTLKEYVAIGEEQDFALCGLAGSPSFQNKGWEVFRYTVDPTVLTSQNSSKDHPSHSHRPDKWSPRLTALQRGSSLLFRRY